MAFPRKIYSFPILFFSCLLLFFSTNTFAQNWYEGGTLHDTNALTWQQATQANKIATCADLIALLYKKEILSPEVRTNLKNINDFKPYAEKLANQLDDAFKPDPDTEKNKKLFTNQKVSSSALMIMLMNGWIKKQ